MSVFYKFNSLFLITNQLTSSPAHQLTSSPAHQLTSSPAHQLTSSPAHQRGISMYSQSQPRKTKSLFKWLAKVTGVTSVWIEGQDRYDRPIWALARQLSHTCWYVVSRCAKASAAIAALGGVLLLPADSLHAQTGITLSEFTGANGFTVHGTSGEYSAHFLATGDINGDGIDDLVITAAAAAPNGTHRAGKTYIVFGQRGFASSVLELSSLDAGTGFVIHGVDEWDQSGSSAATGDINGDGIDDVIIGTPGGAPNGQNSGETYVVFGFDNTVTAIDTVELSSLTGSTGFVLNGADDGGWAYAGDRSGFSVASGDINGDGFGDVIIGAPGANFGQLENYGWTGKTHVVFGFDDTAIDTVELSSLDGNTGFVVHGITRDLGRFGGDKTGNSVASGDINGDGKDDMVIAAYRGDLNGRDSGETFVVFGFDDTAIDTLELSSLNSSTGFILKGVDENDISGDVVSVGDINGDGKDDVLIGAPQANRDRNGFTLEGEIYVVFGFDNVATPIDAVELSSLNGSTGFTIGGIDGKDRSGSAVTAGDINGDGFDDVIVGTAYGYGHLNGVYRPGETSVVFGFDDTAIDTVDLASLDGSTGFVVHGIDPYGYSGKITAAGDINGDGMDDVIFGASSSGGTTYVFTQIPASAELTGNEGMRMLAAPAAGTILDEFLEPLWTQGAIGTDGPQGDPNVWVWDENANTATDSVGNWIAVTDLSGQHMVRGEGFLMHVFADDDGVTPGVQGDFPKMLNTINIFSSAVVDTGTVTPVDNLADGRFFLVGNPYPSTMDWDSASVAKTRLSETIYVYNDANTAWQSWNGTSGNITEGRISPFQSFFVQAFGGTGTLSIGEGARTDSSGILLKQLTGQEPRILSIGAEVGDKKIEAWVNFQEGGELARDKYDGLLLQPFAAEFLKLGTIISSGEVLQINALPVDQQEQLVIPLDLSGTVEASRAALTFEGLEAFEGWELSLRDTYTGEEFAISNNISLELEIEPIRAKLRTSLLPKPMPVKAKTAGSRYQLVVTPAISIHTEPDPGIPSAIELEQNYPNPFNPATTIQFGVPTQGEVRLEVFDMLGRKVAELLNGPMQPGRYSVRFDASALSSGVYIYRLQTGSKSLTQKMTLIK